MVARVGIEPTTRGFSIHHINRNHLILLCFNAALDHYKWRTMSNDVVPNYVNLQQAILGLRGILLQINRKF